MSLLLIRSIDHYLNKPKCDKLLICKDFRLHPHKQHTHCPNVSTTPLRQWGFRQCLPFSWTKLRGKHCRHPIAIMGVVDTFGQSNVTSPRTSPIRYCTVKQLHKLSVTLLYSIGSCLLLSFYGDAFYSETVMF